MRYVHGSSTMFSLRSPAYILWIIRFRIGYMIEAGCDTPSQSIHWPVGLVPLLGGNRLASTGSWTSILYMASMERD